MMILNKYFTGLIAASLLLGACTKDEPMSNNDLVQVSFSATLDGSMLSRAESAATSVANKMVCAIYSNDEELTALRQIVDITPGEDAIFAPKLAKGQTYRVALWAMKDGAYNVDSLTNIYRNDNISFSETDFDAFDYSFEFTVNGAESYPVTLTRPMARINSCITDEDYSAIEALGWTPTHIEITIDNTPDSYNAILRKAIGEIDNQHFYMPIANDSITIEGNEYRLLASGFTFVNGVRKSNLTFTLYGTRSGAASSVEAIYTRSLSEVSLQQNFNTNLILGNIAAEMSGD